ncbi:MAG: hypothetical protein Q8P72_05845 [Candidatus Roizmanbacteria bacterium]|nr:hypothetical protein [Candidatus Roizmanbacteria bacterium]
MTLTEVNYYTKRFAPVIVIVLLVLLILFFGVKLLFTYLSSKTVTTTTSAPVKYETTFDKIKPPIILNAKKPEAFKFELDTLDGTPNVEEATSAAEVYFIPQKTASFGFLSKIYLMAKAAGFNTDTTQHRLDDKKAIFDDGKRKLEIDIRSFNYTYSYTITRDDNINPASPLTAESPQYSEASTFLSQMDRYPTELAQGENNIVYMRLNPETSEIVPLQSPENANIVEVDFFLPDVNGVPVVSSTYYNSQHYVMYLLGGTEKKVIKAQVMFFDRSTDQVGSYPLRTAQEAWEDLKKGKGYIVSSQSPEIGIKIQKVFLAYYDPEVYQEYLQPVYVFLGNNEFVAYVTAVSDEFLIQ